MVNQDNRLNFASIITLDDFKATIILAINILMRINPRNNLYFCTFLACILVTSCERNDLAIITTSPIRNITINSAMSGGTITSDGGTSVIARGVCWSVDPDPTIEDDKTLDGAGGGDFTSRMVDLVSGTPYFVRAYATNNAGTGYGMALVFTTSGLPPQAPEAKTTAVTNLQPTSATLNGIVNSFYLPTTVIFEYGKTISYGSTKTAATDLLTGENGKSVSADILGLESGTTYHFRIRATNSKGTTHGDDLTFTTLGGPPTAITKIATGVNRTSALLNGIANANFLPTDVKFEYGLTTSYGNTINAIPVQVSGNKDTYVASAVSSLTPLTYYHFRIVAINSLGTTYGVDNTFYTEDPPKVKDIDGNEYSTVSIGAQVWFSENLKTTKYNNGNPINFITADDQWQNATFGAYCWYKNDEVTYKDTYGAIYNFYAVQSDKLCPAGWHVPTLSDWNEMISFLGGLKTAGGKLKETGTLHWNSPNTGANNVSGFTGLPGGERYSYSSGLRNLGGWYSSSLYTYNNQTISNAGGVFFLTSDSEECIYTYSHTFVHGLSVRCIKDN